MMIIIMITIIIVLVSYQYCRDSYICIVTNLSNCERRARTQKPNLGEHKPGRIKPGRIKRAALSLQNLAFGNNPV